MPPPIFTYEEYIFANNDDLQRDHAMHYTTMKFDDYCEQRYIDYQVGK